VQQATKFDLIINLKTAKALVHYARAALQRNLMAMGAPGQQGHFERASGCPLLTR